MRPSIIARPYKVGLVGGADSQCPWFGSLPELPHVRKRLVVRVSSGRGCLRCRSQQSGSASCYGGSNGARACCLHFERWNRVRSRHSYSRGYVLIAAISGPGPMMLMTREIVSEDVERHLGGHAWQPLHQEVGCSHPRLERPKRMLDRLEPLAHFFRVLVEPALDGFENMLMLPSA